MSYDGTAHGIGYKEYEIPLTIQIVNECRPSRFYIDDFWLSGGTLGLNSTQFGNQGGIPIVWTTTDLVVEGVTDSSNACEDPIIALDLKMFNDEQSASDIYFSRQGGFENTYETNAGLQGLPVRLMNPPLWDSLSFEPTD